MLRRVAGGTFLYGFGQTLPQVVRFLLLPIYLRFLQPADYGQLDLAMLLGAILVIIMRLGVPGAVTRFYFEHREGPGLKDYVTTIALFLLVSSFVVAGVTLLAGPWLFKWLIPGLPFYPAGLLVIAIAFIGCNQNLQDRLVQAREQAFYAAKLNLGRALVSIVFTAFFVIVMRWGVFGMLLAELIASGVFFLQAARYLWPDLGGRFRPDLLASSLRYALGILPSHLIDTTTPLATRSYLANVGSIAAVGQLGIASRFMQPFSILTSAFTLAFNPIYFSVREHQSLQSLEALARTTRNIWTAAVGCALAGVLIAPPMIRLVTSKGFHVAADLVPILCIGFLAQTLSALSVPEIFYSKKTYFVPVLCWASGMMTIALTVLTARGWGASGIAWAMAAGTLTSAAISVYLSLKMAPIPHHYGDFLRAGGCGLIVLVLARLLSWVLESVAGPSQLLELATATACLLSFPLLLWVSGDRTVRDASDALRLILVRRANSSITS